MIRILAIAAGLWVIGWRLGLPRRLRLALVGLLWLTVVVIHLALPDGHSLRVATGQSAVPWLMAAGIGAVIWLYRRGLSWARARAHAEVVQEAPAAEKCPDGLRAPELDRYSRHIMLREIGGPGQARLARARVLVVGAGGLGAPVLLYLAAAGVGRIRVVDDDAVDLSNLQRQVIHGTDQVGQAKVASTRSAILRLNPHVQVEAVEARFDPAHLESCDLVIDGSDSFAARSAVNAATYAAGVPLLSGAISQWEGQLSLFDPRAGGPCYACVFPNAPQAAPGCAEGGVLGPLPGVIGAMMAVEAVKHLTGAGETLRGRMLIYDALYAETREIRLSPDPACPVCATPA